MGEKVCCWIGKRVVCRLSLFRYHRRKFPSGVDESRVCNQARISSGRRYLQLSRRASLKLLQLGGLVRNCGHVTILVKGKNSFWYPYLVHLPRDYDLLATFGEFEKQALQVLCLLHFLCYYFGFE